MKNVQVEISATPTDFAPYSNICPITGFTGANVYVQSEVDPTADPTANIPFGSTVYGGTLNVTTGVLKSCPYYASYNGETLTGHWISDRDVYAEGTTPTIGAQVVNDGGTLTETQLTPTEVKTLLGQNNIFTDVGEVEVTYYIKG